MLTDTFTFTGLVISAISILILLIYLFKIKQKTQLHKVFIANCSLTFLWAVTLICQVIFSPKYNIEPIKFDYIVYIGACFLPVTLLLTGLVYTKTKIKFSFKHLLLFIVPIVSLLVLWTNDYHHLFYITYSTNIPDTVFGLYFNIYSIYSYICIAVALLLLISYAIKNSGFFSSQSILIIIGTFVPVSISLLGYVGIIEANIYITPVTYIITIFCYAFAIFRFKLFKTSPIALQHVVDRISDSYLVLDSYNKIIDFNATFIKTFHISNSNRLRNMNIFDFSKISENFEIDENHLKSDLDIIAQTNKTIMHDLFFTNMQKYFSLEITGILNDHSFIGTILLFKDTTQHTKDMKTIRDNQDMLVEKERLASLGQMIGGIAHNLKTPIMSISGAVEGLNDLVTEYEASVGDSDVTIEDHHAIAKDMKNWLEKIKTHMGYMSDVITAVKGQAVTFSEEQSTNFTINEMLKMVSILMKHELNSALVTLNIQNNVSADILLHGNINSLVQVINNIISNAIQASINAQNKTIDFAINHIGDNIIMSIRDYGCGMPLSIQETLFKKMVTTKGKNGTGLGLFMSYSNIKAHFNGDITFESEEGKGTQFDIILPM